MTHAAVSAEEMDRLQAIGRDRGFAAVMPVRPTLRRYARRYGMPALEHRFGFGATCSCQGTRAAPLCIALRLGDTSACPICGTVFHLFDDFSGIGIRPPAPRDRRRPRRTRRLP